MAKRNAHRTERVAVYLTPREAQEIDAAIERAQEPASEWRRKALLAAARNVLDLEKVPSLGQNR